MIFFHTVINTNNDCSYTVINWGCSDKHRERKIIFNGVATNWKIENVNGQNATFGGLCYSSGQPLRNCQVRGNASPYVKVSSNCLLLRLSGPAGFHTVHYSHQGGVGDQTDYQQGHTAPLLSPAVVVGCKHLLDVPTRSVTVTATSHVMQCLSHDVWEQFCLVCHHHVKLIKKKQQQTLVTVICGLDLYGVVKVFIFSFTACLVLIILYWSPGKKLKDNNVLVRLSRLPCVWHWASSWFVPAEESNLYKQVTNT